MIQKRTILALMIIMLAGSGVVAEAEFIIFKGGNADNVKISNWRQSGINVVSREEKTRGKKTFYYYVEIESIDGDTIEYLKSHIALMTLWSNIKNRMPKNRKGDKRRMYGAHGSILKKQDTVCKSFKWEKTIKIYNKKGALTVEKVCDGGELMNVKMYQEGAVKRVLFFKNNELVAVQRFTGAGEPEQPGFIVEE